MLPAFTSGACFGARARLTSAGGWQYDTLANAANVGFCVYNFLTHANHFAPWPAPDGDLVMYLKGTDCQGTADVTVPGGDFEGVTDLGRSLGSHEPNLGGGTTAEGWQLATENGAWSGAALKPAAIATQGVSAYRREKESSTSPYRRSWYSFYECGGPNVFGFAQLALLSTGGVAGASTASCRPRLIRTTFPDQARSRCRSRRLC